MVFPLPLNSASLLVKYGERDGQPAHSNWYNRDENHISDMHHIKSYFTVNLWGNNCYNDLTYLQGSSRLHFWAQPIS